MRDVSGAWATKDFVTLRLTSNDYTHRFPNLLSTPFKSYKITTTKCILPSRIIIQNTNLLYVNYQP